VLGVHSVFGPFVLPTYRPPTLKGEISANRLGFGQTFILSN